MKHNFQPKTLDNISKIKVEMEFLSHAPIRALNHKLRQLKSHLRRFIFPGGFIQTEMKLRYNQDIKKFYITNKDRDRFYI